MFYSSAVRYIHEFDTPTTVLVPGTVDLNAMETDSSTWDVYNYTVSHSLWISLTLRSHWTLNRRVFNDQEFRVQLHWHGRTDMLPGTTSYYSGRNCVD